MLRHLFVDLNSYFASVEQEFRPELRGKPVAVVAVMTDRTCCLAASYEAKRFGIKTGTPVGEARRMCPGLKVVEARTDLYVITHHKIVAAVDSVVPVDKVRSIDEMSCRLPAAVRTIDEITAAAQEVKRAIARQVGSTLKCSIGVAPNVLLAKVATDMQKPDGLTIVQQHELPERLLALKPSDFPGIGGRMTERLQRHGITTTKQLYEASVELLSRVWGSRLIGESWWRRIRGEDLPEVPTHRRTVGHSHVLPPELRTDAGAHGVLVRLIHKAAARLRRYKAWARCLTIGVQYLGNRSWADAARFPYARDTLTFLEAFETVWSRRPGDRPLKVSITLLDLRLQQDVARSLFAEDAKRSALADAMDAINGQFNGAGIHFAGMLGMQKTAPARIAFSSIPSVLHDLTSDE